MQFNIRIVIDGMTIEEAGALSEKEGLRDVPRKTASALNSKMERLFPLEMAGPPEPLPLPVVEIPNDPPAPPKRKRGRPKKADK